MILLYLAVIAFFVWYSTRSFEKSFFLFVVVRLFFNPGMALRYQPPALTVDFLLCAYFCVMFFINRKRYRIFSDSCFFEKSFFLMIISYAVSTAVAVLDGNMSAISWSIRIVLCNYLIYIIFWRVCTSDFLSLCVVKTIETAFIFVLLYGVFEAVAGINPVLNFINSSIPQEYSADKMYLSDLSNLSRGGRARYQSLFYITILYGIAMMLFAFYIPLVKNIYTHKNKLFYPLLFAGCLIASFLSNSKTPIVAFPIFLIPYLKKRAYAIPIILGCVIVFFLSYSDQSFISNFIDMNTFDTKNYNSRDGSNMQMRLNQLEISWTAFCESPIVGNGIKYASYLAKTSRGFGLLGAESCWFKLLIEQGAVGIFAYLTVIFSFLKMSLHMNRNIRYPLFFYACGFFVMASITDIAYDVFFLLYITVVKVHYFYQHEKGGCIS